MRARRVLSLLLVLILGVASQYCGGSKKIIIKGVVIRPDSSRVEGAAVRTQPPSEIVYTNTDGVFTISEGLQPGAYEFIAEVQGNEGRTRAPIQYSKRAQVIVVKIGATLQMRPMQPGDERLPSISKGKKR
jgi:hypothetical protein